MSATEENVIECLEGWIIEIDDTSDEDKDRAVCVVTKKDVTSYIQKAVKRAKGYTNNNNLDITKDEIVIEAIETWTAGLLWNKKLRDQSIPDKSDKVIQTGDALIEEAKEMLNPYVIPVDNTEEKTRNKLVIGTAYITDD